MSTPTHDGVILSDAKDLSCWTLDPSLALLAQDDHCPVFCFQSSLL
jgi:hypothetical protein